MSSRRNLSLEFRLRQSGFRDVDAITNEYVVVRVGGKGRIYSQTMCL